MATLYHRKKIDRIAFYNIQTFSVLFYILSYVDIDYILFFNNLWQSFSAVVKTVRIYPKGTIPGHKTAALLCLQTDDALGTTDTKWYQ